jgi:hypothetical protein
MKHVVDKVVYADFTLRSAFMANYHLMKVVSMKFATSRKYAQSCVKHQNKW